MVGDPLQGPCPLLGCISSKVSERIWYRFKHAHPLSSVLLMLPRKAVDSESHSSCYKNLPFRRRQEVSARVHSPLIHTLHQQPDFALASPLWEGIVALQTPVSNISHHPLAEDPAETLGISQHRRRLGKNPCHGTDSQIHISKQRQMLSENTDLKIPSGLRAIKRGSIIPCKSPIRF